MEIGELKKLFDDMTIEEKAGQLFQTVGAMYDDEAVISGPMQEMGITEKDIQLAGTVLGTMGAVCHGKQLINGDSQLHRKLWQQLNIRHGGAAFPF